MKVLIFSVLAAMAFPATSLAENFSPEEIVGSYKSLDEKANVLIRKVLVSEATLFDPPQYLYSVDIQVDGGPCMEMYGNDQRVVQFKARTFRYNGAWKPKEYLVAEDGQDSDTDGSVFVSEARFTATKTSLENGSASYSFEVSIDISHNPDFGDGEDGGQGAFAQCDRDTVKDWQLIKSK